MLEAELRRLIEQNGPLEGDSDEARAYYAAVRDGLELAVAAAERHGEPLASRLPLH